MTKSLQANSEVRAQFEHKHIGREHIVKPIPDHDVTYQVRIGLFR